jgi:hypothetical protein
VSELLCQLVKPRRANTYSRSAVRDGVVGEHAPTEGQWLIVRLEELFIRRDDLVVLVTVHNTLLVCL